MKHAVLISSIFRNGHNITSKEDLNVFDAEVDARIHVKEVICENYGGQIDWGQTWKAIFDGGVKLYEGEEICSCVKYAKSDTNSFKFRCGDDLENITEGSLSGYAVSFSGSDVVRILRTKNKAKQYVLTQVVPEIKYVSNREEGLFRDEVVVTTEEPEEGVYVKIFQIDNGEIKGQSILDVELCKTEDGKIVLENIELVFSSNLRDKVTFIGGNYGDNPKTCIKIKRRESRLR